MLQTRRIRFLFPPLISSSKSCGVTVINEMAEAEEDDDAAIHSHLPNLAREIMTIVCLFLLPLVSWLVGKLRSSAMLDYLLTWKIRKMREMVRVATFHED